MSAAGSEPDLARLRALLLGDETRRLAGAETRLAKLETLLGDPLRLEAVARVLSEALREGVPTEQPPPASAGRLVAGWRAVGWLIVAFVAVAALGLALREPFERARNSAEIGTAMQTQQAGLARLGDSVRAQQAELQSLAARLFAAELAAPSLRADVAAKIAAIRAQAGELSAASKLQGEEILALAAGIDTDAPPVAQAEMLRLASAKAAQSLATAAVAARDLGAKIDDARARAAALSALLAETDAVGLQSDAAAVVTALDAVKADDARAQATWRAEAEDARHRADMSEALKQSLARNAAAVVSAIARDSRIAFADGDAFADPDGAAARIAGLADAMAHTGVGVRVVGVAAPSGDPAAALATARARAAEVAQRLVQRGVPASRAVAVARLASKGETPGVVFEPLPP